MSQYLASEDWNVDVVCERPNYPTGVIIEEYNKQWATSESVNANLNIHRIWSVANQRRNVMEQLLFFISFMISSIFYVLTHPKRYDVIYVTSPPIFTGVSGYILSKILGAKFVFEVRDIWPDSAVNQTDLENESLFLKLGKKLENWLYHNADLIVPVTPAAEQIIKARSNGTPTTVIPNGVDVDLFTKKENPKSEMDEPYDASKFRVGYVGSLGVIHDLRTFVEAAKICEEDPDIQFIIVGDGGRNNQLQDIIEEFKPNNLDWVGLKKHEQIPYYISSFDLAINPINPSKAFESIVTVKFYEYLACGIPVITCGKGMIKEIGNQSGAAITIEPKNPALLASEIKNFKSDKNLNKKLSSAGQHFVNDVFSRKNLAIKLSNELKKQLAG